jgi:hypothetical protein
MVKGLREAAFAVVLLPLTACGAPAPATMVATESAPTATATPFVQEADEPDIDELAPSGDRAPQATPASASVLKLETLLSKESNGFPSATQGDAECIRAVGLVGDIANDYRELAKQCGTGTGMSEYTHASSGNLDATSHPSDTYAVTMAGGLCYRYFVVGDTGLSHFNVTVRRPNGAVLSMAKTTEGVLLLNPKKAWCKRHDREFHIVIEAKGQAAGAYTFGVWARPGKDESLGR